MTSTPTTAPTVTSAPVLELTDPFVCGVGFSGSIQGGTAPYVLGYTLSAVGGGDSAATAEINLGQFSVTAAGPYASPASYIDPLDGINDDYLVTITVTDSAGAAVSVVDAFVASVRTPCTKKVSSSSVGSAPLAYPGPFSVAPGSGPVGGNGAVPTSGGSLGNGGSVASDGGTQPPASPPLATTGADTPVLASLSLLFMTLGGVLLVASRREQDKTRS